MIINKEVMIEGEGAALTQSLFLETSCEDKEYAQYTLKPLNHACKGKKLHKTPPRH
ncbi:hypothetical protein VP242E401_P0058 [Vibrio phage 242E40-1]|nr:hypothetical protein VP242E401_P0058 [Vibrio phage 242E40-1]